MPDGSSLQDAFAAIDRALDGSSYDVAVEFAASLVAADADALASELAGDVFDADAWRRIFWRTVEVIDTQRRAGMLAADEAVERIYAINRHLAQAAHGAVDIAEIHRRLLDSPPDAETRARSPFSRVQVVNRVRQDVEALAPSFTEKSEAEIAEVGARLAMGRREHAANVRLADASFEAGLLTEDEHATIVRALGRYRRETMGWDRATTPAMKLAVTRVLDELRAALG